MKRFCFLLSLVAVGCGQSPSSTIDSDLTIQDTILVAEPEVKVEHDWLTEFPENIKSQKDSFYTIDAGKFKRSIIDQFYTNHGTRLNTGSLKRIDSLVCSELFGTNQSSYGSFYGSYLYSIEKPFLGLYPITVIPYFGVVDRPLLLTLFDENGSYVSFVEVANSYGEGGSSMESSFVNQGELIRKYNWVEFAGFDSLGIETFERSSKRERIEIDSSGQITITEI